MATNSYRVRSCAILHDGQDYPEGATIELDARAARRLAEFLEVIPSKKDKAKSAGDEPEGGES